MDRRLALIAILPATLAACHATPIDAPSLAFRPVERQPIDTPDAAAEPTLPADPALAGRLAPIVADARQGHAAFLVQRDETAAAVARAAGSAAGSEAWLTAQQALSALDGVQAPVRNAAAAIDAIRTEPGNAAAANRAIVDAAATTVDALNQGEAAATAALAARLR